MTTGAAQRRADYAFYVNPNFRDPRLLVEAKRPAGEIATPENYFQAVRYGWNKQNPLVGLTTFDQLHILDCRYKPDIDKSIHCGVRKYQLQDYFDLEKFTEIYWLLSREAVADGSLEKFAASLPKPKKGAKQRGLWVGGYKSLDEAFLEDLDNYRMVLARAFKKGNPELDSDTLTEVTQRTLDRLVFMRFLEDKLIEPEHFVAHFGKRGTAWQGFIAASRRLDRIYNGIVFKKHRILDDPEFPVDDEAFARICEELSHQNSPYDFNAIPIHILGSIYERFLGNVIVATDKRVRVEAKPEVRKAGGVYYTPDYIVRYIVENTVGKLIEGKTPDQIAEMRFADIACGSGSFLLGVYDLLLRYYAKYYNEHPRAVRKGDCVEKDGVRHLSLEKKREILLNNIYGVDLDPQAAEVTQLSLYLKLLDEESIASTHGYQKKLHAAILPPLNLNIVCGNSLIGTDILEGKLFDIDDERRLSPMDFADAFPEVVKRGGFDVIVGNPPYVSMLLLDKSQATSTKKYWKENYESAAGAFDIYVLFIERAVTLVRDEGFVSFIVPNKFLAAEYAVAFRKWLLDNCSFVSLLDFSRVKVWPVSVYPVVPVFRKSAIEARHRIAVSVATTASTDNLQQLASVPSGMLKEIPDNLWSFMTQNGAAVLMRVLDGCEPLEDVAEIWGASTVAEGSEYPQLLIDNGTERLPGNTARFVVSGSIERYGTTWRTYPVQFTHRKYTRPLISLKHPMPERRAQQSRQPKIIICKVGLEPRAFPDFKGEFLGAYTTYVFPKSGSLAALTGLINSRLMRFVYRLLYDALAMSGGYLRFQPPQIRRLPIPVLDQATRSVVEKEKRLVSLVERLVKAVAELDEAPTDNDRNYIKRKCAGLDRQIDVIVYELYGLTEDEIKIVEGKSQA